MSDSNPSPRPVPESKSSGQTRTRDYLIKRSEFVEAVGLKKYRLGAFGGLIMGLLRIHKINRLYRATYKYDGTEFVDKVFARMGVRLEVDPQELRQIPAEGPFLVVSNHPFGALDGLAMIRTLAEARPDFRVMANFILHRIEPIKPYVFAVNPFEEQKEAASSYAGIKQCLQHLRDGHPVGLFPAGEVSTFQADTRTITDREWQRSALRIIEKARVPVVPIFFPGGNSKIFHLLGRMNGQLRTARLPTELLNKRNETLRLRIGMPITVAEQEQFTDTDRLGRYVRTRVYALGSAMGSSNLEVGNFFKKPLFHVPQKEKKIGEETPSHVLKAEVENLHPDLKIHSQGVFDIYICRPFEIPQILGEIGRLREITFREMGEGTGKKTDLDEYDLYYHHLFIWDREASKIVGSYRMGKGKDILARFGIKGFYVDSLFKIDPNAAPILGQTIELGRSFIVKEYQRQPKPLFMLWQGILYFLLKNPEYRYLLGPVSISNDISDFSKALMVRYIETHHHDVEMAKYFTPLNRFAVDFKDIDPSVILDQPNADLKFIDKYIGQIETSGMRVPVLVKKYLNLNAKILGFNVDPLFNNSLDGLIWLDLREIPKDVIDSLKKEFKLMHEE